MLKILWKMGEIAPEEQFHPLSTIFYYLMLNFYAKTGIRFSLRDKWLFEITEVEITRVDCTTISWCNGDIEILLACHLPFSCYIRYLVLTETRSCSADGSNTPCTSSSYPPCPLHPPPPPGAILQFFDVFKILIS